MSSRTVFSPDHEQLTAALRDLDKARNLDLVRNNDLGVAFNFEPAAPFVGALLDLYKDLANCDLGLLPEAIARNHSSLAQECKKLIESISAFSPTEPNSKTLRDQIIKRSRDLYDGHWQRVAPSITYCKTKEGRLEGAIQSTEKAKVEFQEKINELLSSFGQSEARAQNIVKGMEKAAATVGVDRHGIEFSNQANEHQKAAWAWMTATVIFCVAGGILLHHYFIGAGKPDDLTSEKMTTAFVVFEIATRLLIFSFVSFAMYWSAKNFTSHRHNYVVNRHRQNALTTFNAFTDAAGNDERTKNAVLLQAAQAIYTPQSTGYADTGGPPQGMGGILEVVREIPTAKGS